MHSIMMTVNPGVNTLTWPIISLEITNKAAINRLYMVMYTILLVAVPITKSTTVEVKKII